MKTRPTNDVIREIFLRKGFKIPPELTDMRPYVYEAARELLRYYGVWTYDPETNTERIRGAGETTGMKDLPELNLPETGA